jgi:CheY-like chemotaxis protein
MSYVLVVDDQPDMREVLEAMIQMCGCTTQAAADGREALDAMRHDPPCLVVFDLMMPVMDGFEFRARQLRDPQLAAIPAVCVTAMFDAGVVEHTLGVRCVPKPIDFEILDAIVRNACGR